MADSIHVVSGIARNKIILLILVLVAALTLIVFGPDKLPELARQLGRIIGEVRRFSSEATAEIQRTLSLDEPGVARPKNSISGAIRRPNDKLEESGSSRPEGPLPPY